MIISAPPPGSATPFAAKAMRTRIKICGLTRGQDVDAAVAAGAAAIGFVVGQPPHVHLDDIRIRPTRQKV